jgi:AP-3 complex subunit beta
MSRGMDCSEFFADVVKNVASPALEIKKLVYIYLLRYAESEPDLALLSINTIQKALNDQNQVVRAMAIRVMSGIKVPVISQIVALGIKKGVTDMSAYVRKCAALAIPKCYQLDSTTMPQLTDHLGTLLGDRSHYVMGAAAMAFLEICPFRYDLIHPHYRILVKMLIDMDEWGQLAMLRLLTGYARKTFPTKRRKKVTNGESAFYLDGETVGHSVRTQDVIQDMDPDLDLFLRACPPLLQSRNSAVRTQ